MQPKIQTQPVHSNLGPEHISQISKTSKLAFLKLNFWFPLICPQNHQNWFSSAVSKEMSSLFSLLCGESLGSFQLLTASCLVTCFVAFSPTLLQLTPTWLLAMWFGLILALISCLDLYAPGIPSSRPSQRASVLYSLPPTSSQTSGFPLFAVDEFLTSGTASLTWYYENDAVCIFMTIFQSSFMT